MFIRILAALLCILCAGFAAVLLWASSGSFTEKDAVHWLVLICALLLAGIACYVAVTGKIPKWIG